MTKENATYNTSIHAQRQKNVLAQSLKQTNWKRNVITAALKHFPNYPFAAPVPALTISVWAFIPI